MKTITDKAYNKIIDYIYLNTCKYSHALNLTESEIKRSIVEWINAKELK